jgi:hypothetical protein
MHRITSRLINASSPHKSTTATPAYPIIPHTPFFSAWPAHRLSWPMLTSFSVVFNFSSITQYSEATPHVA